jgi:hypothetical protein
VNRSVERFQLVKDGGPPKCPACGAHLAFATDREGQAIARCACGYRAYIERRTGKREPPATP